MMKENKSKIKKAREPTQTWNKFMNFRRKLLDKNKEIWLNMRRKGKEKKLWEEEKQEL